jgi:hypothetical protein
MRQFNTIAYAYYIHFAGWAPKYFIAYKAANDPGRNIRFISHFSDAAGNKPFV